MGKGNHMVSKETAVVRCCKALADPTRQQILELLTGRALSVLEIAEEFPMSRPAISKHLRILRDAGLVAERPAGRQRIYALEAGPLLEVERWLAGLTGRAVSPSGNGAAAGRRRPAVRLRLGDWRVW